MCVFRSLTESSLWHGAHEACVALADVRVDNASQSIVTDSFLTCPGTAWTSAAAAHSVFPSMHIYSMHRAYGLTFFDPFDLCTFPVGAPDTPYYRCHSGDLYEARTIYFIPLALPGVLTRAYRHSAHTTSSASPSACRTMSATPTSCRICGALLRALATRIHPLPTLPRAATPARSRCSGTFLGLSSRAESRLPRCNFLRRRSKACRTLSDARSC
jgi:hypothetical protein